MGLVDKMKNIFVSDPEEEFVEDGDEMEFVETSRSSRTQRHQNVDFDDSAYETTKKSSEVVDIRATTSLQVILVKPEQFEEASSIADHLNQKKTVVLNLESASKELSRRMVDFLSGVAYANNGQIKRVANSTFIITPYNVDIEGDLIDELENKGVYL